jgi:hypothetical protein
MVSDSKNNDIRGESRRLCEALRGLCNEGKINIRFRASLDYLYSLFCGLGHAGEQVMDFDNVKFDASAMFYFLRAGYSHIFKNVLYVLG